MTDISQKQANLRHLKSGKVLSPFKLWIFIVVTALVQILLEKLRKQGYDIVTHYEKNKRGNGSYARYELRRRKI